MKLSLHRAPLAHKSVWAEARVAATEKPPQGLKVLGHGELNKKLTVKATKLTKTAQDKINAAGGSVEVIG